MTTLSALLQGIVSGVPDIPVSGLALDNRLVRQGVAFVALRGTRQHGLAYAAAAVEAGAVVVVYEPDVDAVVPVLPVPVLAVPELSKHLGVMAARFYQQPADDLFMVGITGTDGKTSVSHFVAEALEAAGMSAAVLGTLGIGRPGELQAATHTTPDAIQVQAHLRALREQGFVSVAMEVSSHALDQGRVNAVGFDVAVLTNLTRDHLDYHGTVEAYADAKRKLFHWQGLRRAVLNLDDAFGKKLATELAGSAVRVIGYGVGDVSAYPSGTLVASNARFDDQGIHAEVLTQKGMGRLYAPVLGRFNLHNLLAALGVLLAKGLSLDTALRALQQVRTVPGRMERVQVAGHGDGVLVVVDYAHTPGALEQVLLAVRAHTYGRLICVFGCGGDRDAGKRPLMAQAAERGADLVIVTDDNPRTESSERIFTDIHAGFVDSTQVIFEHDRASAIRMAIQHARAGDAVLIAGKGHEAVQILADRAVPFDDRQQAAQALLECAV